MNYSLFPLDIVSIFMYGVISEGWSSVLFLMSVMKLTYATLASGDLLYASRDRSSFIAYSFFIPITLPLLSELKSWTRDHSNNSRFNSCGSLSYLILAHGRSAMIILVHGQGPQLVRYLWLLWLSVSRHELDMLPALRASAVIMEPSSVIIHSLGDYFEAIFDAQSCSFQLRVFPFLSLNFLQSSKTLIQSNVIYLPLFARGPLSIAFLQLFHSVVSRWLFEEALLCCPFHLSWVSFSITSPFQKRSQNAWESILRIYSYVMYSLPNFNVFSMQII